MGAECFRTPRDLRRSQAVCQARGSDIAHELAADFLGDLTDRGVAASTYLATTRTAKEVTALRRRFELDGDTLGYTVAMAAVGQPLQHHLAATLHRVG